MTARISKFNLQHINTDDATSHGDWSILAARTEKEVWDAAYRVMKSGGDGNLLRKRLKKGLPGFPVDRAIPLDKDCTVICLMEDKDLKEEPNKESLTLAPLATFGKLVLTDRGEIEAYRGIYHQLERYWSNENLKKPLSLAIFGPPGSGKSFGINQVLESLKSKQGKNNKTKEVKVLEYNLAQFTEEEDLAKAFMDVVDENVSGHFPVVFFDEFDSNDLKWLRYFLAPMQDGQFFYDGKLHTIGRAVFVFAGGTSYSFDEFRGDRQTIRRLAGVRVLEEFFEEYRFATDSSKNVISFFWGREHYQNLLNSLSDRGGPSAARTLVDNICKTVIDVFARANKKGDRLEATTRLNTIMEHCDDVNAIMERWDGEYAAAEERIQHHEAGFRKAKGPDFISRLSGFIDVLGVNPDYSVVNHHSYLLRRAMVIRSELGRLNLLGRTKQSLVERPFLQALLNVYSFKHGARSISKIMEMCLGENGVLQIPHKSQLAMHLSSEGVKQLVQRVERDWPKEEVG